jgi:hypothetical protein
MSSSSSSTRWQVYNEASSYQHLHAAIQAACTDMLKHSVAQLMDLDTVMARPAQREELLALPRPALEELLGSPQLRVCSEDTVLHALMLWADSPRGSLQEAMELLQAKVVRLPLLSHHALLLMLVRSTTFSTLWQQRLGDHTFSQLITFASMQSSSPSSGAALRQVYGTLQPRKAPALADTGVLLRMCSLGRLGRYLREQQVKTLDTQQQYGAYRYHLRLVVDGSGVQGGVQGARHVLRLYAKVTPAQEVAGGAAPDPVLLQASWQLAVVSRRVRAKKRDGRRLVVVRQEHVHQLYGDEFKLPENAALQPPAFDWPCLAADGFWQLRDNIQVLEVAALLEPLGLEMPTTAAASSRQQRSRQQCSRRCSVFLAIHKIVDVGYAGNYASA